MKKIFLIFSLICLILVFALFASEVMNNYYNYTENNYFKVCRKEKIEGAWINSYMEKCYFINQQFIK